MKEIVLYLTDRKNRIADRMPLQDSTLCTLAQGVLFHQRDTDYGSEICDGLYENVYPFTSDILFDLGYKPIGDSLVPGNAHFPVLGFYLKHPEFDYYWVVEDDVRFSGQWNEFFHAFDADDADLIASYITRYADDKSWPWWHTFSSAADKTISPDDMVRSFHPIYRLSNRALQTLHEKMTEEWHGHFEVLIPTVLSWAGLKLHDMRRNAPFSAENLSTDFYDEQTLSHMPLRIQTERENMIYHPVKEKASAHGFRRNCVISAVGCNSLHRGWVKDAAERSFDLHLIVYDNSFARYCRDADYVSYRKGFKLRLVYDYLRAHPDYIEAYDYFFIPDDDIQASSEEIETLFRLMDAYKLQIAQPALRHSYFTHPITLRKPLSILRHVNFVEMMLPCFSREALKRVFTTFDANESGWGVEFHWEKLIGKEPRRMAIIDAVSMIHTQPVKQGRTENFREMQEYVTAHGLDTRQETYDVVLRPSVEKDDYYNVMNYLDTLRLIAQKLLLTIKMGEIKRVGLDGQTGIALFLLEVARWTEDKNFYDLGRYILQTVKKQTDDIPQKPSFFENEEGILWAFRYVSTDNHPSHLPLCRMMKYISERQESRCKTELFRIKNSDGRC